MYKQWTIITALFFTMVVAIFAVMNVEPVKVDFLFGTAEWPLILVILACVLMGALITGLTGAFQIIKLKKELKTFKTKKTEEEQSLISEQRE
ncbi:LapA family protein [Bacillus changyiensis]|uniref:LapA family protein n=1 Tax=Bacillus changyiensis TaxID=3004103 RepID=UPI0022E0C9C6|nr:lipopolysaccharide assembly protein LapA domain-containing protein [Bacillus changyiensis]MDA1477408.1 lipopolysaccharide assembly protein LapA domain-containing protein [Bacillus changyiensis]